MKIIDARYRYIRRNKRHRGKLIRIRKMLCRRRNLYIGRTKILTSHELPDILRPEWHALLQNQGNHMTVSMRCTYAGKVMEAVSASTDQLIAIQWQNGFRKRYVSTEREYGTPLASSRCGGGSYLSCLGLYRGIWNLFARG